MVQEHARHEVFRNKPVPHGVRISKAAVPRWSVDAESNGAHAKSNATSAPSSNEKTSRRSCQIDSKSGAVGPGGYGAYFTNPPSSASARSAPSQASNAFCKAQ